MSAIRLYHNDLGKWVFDHQGSEHVALLSSVDTADTFRSFGLHPKGVVCISVCQSGQIDDITLLDQTPVRELFVPTGHSLYRDLTPT